MKARSRAAARIAVALLAAATLVTACANPEDETPAPAGSGGEQVVETGAPTGSGCTLQQYGAREARPQERDRRLLAVGEGGQPVPDRRDPVDPATRRPSSASKKLHGHQRPVAARPSRSADIQDMLAQGAQFLIVAPLNSDGLEPALQAAAAKKVPVLTIDRKINATACKDYLAFLGSNFVEQGKRAADAMIKATGGKGKVAILLGSSGNNVTTDRTNGFVDQVKAKAPGLSRSSPQQTGEFARDKGQQVTEQLISEQPGHHRDLRRERRDGPRRGHRAARPPARSPARTSRSSPSTAPATPCRPSWTAPSTRSSSPTRASARWRSRPLQDVLRRRPRSRRT